MKLHTLLQHTRRSIPCSTTRHHTHTHTLTHTHGFNINSKNSYSVIDQTKGLHYAYEEEEIGKPPVRVQRPIRKSEPKSTNKTTIPASLLSILANHTTSHRKVGTSLFTASMPSLPATPLWKSNLYSLGTAG